MEEKLSLANRFGVTIGYYKPSRQEFYDIVTALSKKSGLRIDPDQLKIEADRWEMSHGGISGRTAQQFVDHLLGENVI